MNFYTTSKVETLNDRLTEVEKRFQLKLDELQTQYTNHIQKLDNKIDRLENESLRTYELIDKL